MRTIFSLLLAVLIGWGCGGEEYFTIESELPTARKNSFYTSNEDPLLRNPLVQIPLGDIRAMGWLQTQLELMTNGYTGNLYTISKFLNKDSGWLGGDERGWEEAPYWLRGFYDLSVLVDVPRIDSVAKSWMEAVINSEQANGYYGSSFNRMVTSKNGTDSLPDLWPQMVMNDVLIDHYEATGDERIIPMLLNFFRYCKDLPDDQFLPMVSWDYYEHYKEHFGDWKPRIQLKRAGDLVPQIYWLYNQTQEDWLLELALKVYHKTQPEMNQWLDNHVVHFSQRFRYPAQMFPMLKDSFYLEKTEFFYNQFLLTWGQLPRGGFAADEFIRNGKVDPRQGFESCAIVEGNKSFYILGNTTGDTRYADKIEDLTFNWLPASTSPDLKTLRYLTGANMVKSVPHMDFDNKGEHPVFSEGLHRCCQHNTSMGWPWFVKNMWKASHDNGVVAWLYGPNEVTARVGEDGNIVKISGTTDFPFKDEITYKLDLNSPTTFPLYLRIPGWAEHLALKINGLEKEISKNANNLIKINRKWEDGDIIEVTFYPEISLKEWPRTKSITIDRGPLSYSVFIDEEWVRIPATEKFPHEKFQLLPGSAWNYGLMIVDLNPSADIGISIAETFSGQPWDAKSVPITLSVPAKKIPAWKASVLNTVDPLREGPVRSNEKEELIKMIPMGAARLRLTCLPVISNEQGARAWEEIPDPNIYMLDKLGKK